MKEVKPYDEQTGSKKQQVSKMFDNIAPYYDFLNRLLSLGIDKNWRKRMIAELRKDQPQYILDVATGTADVALEVNRQLQPKKVIGVDIAPEMLEIGRKKIAKQQLQEQIELRDGDSENLPFEDDTFDAVTVAFGVRNYENLQKGLQEMRRVLKPGGRLIVLEFSQPTLFPFKQLFQFYFKNILPTIGKVTSKDPKAYRYLYESVQAFPDGKDFLTELEKAGLTAEKHILLTLGISSIYTSRK